MKIKLTKTGGIAGVAMQSIINWKGNEQDWQTLIEAIQIPESSGGKKKDAFHYTLEQVEKNNSRVVINPAVVPKSFHAFFQELFDGLKPVSKT